MISNIFRLVFGAALAVWMLKVLVDGFRSGRIRHTDSVSVYSFGNQPIRFTLVVVLFILLAALFSYVAIDAATAMLRART